MFDLVALANDAKDLITNYKRSLVRTRTLEVCREFMGKFSIIYNQYIKLKELEVNTKIIEETEAIFDELSKYLDDQYDILKKEAIIELGEESSSNILDQNVKDNNKVDLKSIDTLPELKNQELQGKNQVETGEEQQNQNLNFNPENINNQINQIQPIMAGFDMVNKRINANIPIFSGGSNETAKSELKVFLNQCDYIMNSLERNEANIAFFLQGLLGRFRGIAYDIVTKANPANYGALKKLLQDLYLPTKTMSEVNQALYSCKQKSNESTREFVVRINGHLEDAKTLLRAKFPEHNDSLIANIEAEAVNVFKRGTSNVGMKQHLLLNDAATLDILAAAAYTYEDTERQISAGFVYQAQASPVNAVYGNNNNIREDQNKGYNQFNRYPFNNDNRNLNNRGRNFPNQQNSNPTYNGYNNRNRQTQDNYGRNFQNNNMRYQYKCGLCGNSGHTDQFCALGRKCPNCKTWDHSIKYCPYNIKNVEKEENKVIFCGNCGIRGHISDECPTLRIHQSTNEVSGNAMVQAKDIRASAQ